VLASSTCHQGWKIAGVCKETAYGAKDDRAQRKEVLALAQARKVDAILVTKLTRAETRSAKAGHTGKSVIGLGRARIRCSIS
jgi:hypothetical protein